MTSLPVALRANTWPCLVVGGGRVATRKVRSLLEAQASVTVVAPKISVEIAALAALHGLTMHEREFQPSDCVGARIVVTATNRTEVNQLAADEGTKIGALINRDDDADSGDLAFGAVARMGNVSIMVATEGVNPAVARWLRDHIAETLTPTIARLDALLDAVDGEPSRRSYEAINERMSASTEGTVA